MVQKSKLNTGVPQGHCTNISRISGSCYELRVKQILRTCYRSSFISFGEGNLKLLETFHFCSVVNILCIMMRLAVYLFEEW